MELYGVTSGINIFENEKNYSILLFPCVFAGVCRTDHKEHVGG